MAREELVSSAITFLQDPSVASSPVEKRVAFLQSKNLTQEEIDLALARAGDDSSVGAVAATPPSGGYSQPQSYRPPPPPGPGYGYGSYQQWQPPPPELPRRDWRDWFIMATVTGGVGYGLYFVAKKYIAPLISPPTTPQLQQDKESIDEQFTRAFTLLEQLSTDTATLKSAEEARTERLDAALREVEVVVTDLKSSSRRRDDDSRRMADEVRTLRDSIPKAMEGAREGNEKRLKELTTELKSLKVLVGNRLGGGSAAAATPAARPVTGASVSASPRPSEDATTTSGTANGASATSQVPNLNRPPSQASSPVTTPAASAGTSSPFSGLGKPAAIPAWQMAAANKSKAASSSEEQQSAPAT